jgi:hypothetical protein
MALRHDALVAAAHTVASVRRMADQFAAEGSGYFVATVGILDVDPSASNIVPGRCRLVVDVRTTAPELMQRFADTIDRESLAHAAAARVTRASFTMLSDGPPTICDTNLRAALRRGAHDPGLGDINLASGAGHDAVYMSRICPSAMVFIPCRAGKSHAPEEWADREAIAAGAAVIYQAVRELDQALAWDRRTAAWLCDLTWKLGALPWDDLETQIVRDALPKKLLFDIIYNARLIGAQEACDVHVVNKSVPRARVLQEAIRMATTASSYNSDVVMLGRDLYYNMRGVGPAEAVDKSRFALLAALAAKDREIKRS